MSEVIDGFGSRGIPTGASRALPYDQGVDVRSPLEDAMLAQLVIATSDAEISRDGVPVAW